MSNLLTIYFDALERLKIGKPIRVPNGTRITNDAVSLEAGRGKGSIKKSRPVFSELIKEIDAAADQQLASQSSVIEKVRLLELKKEAAYHREQLEAAWARELSLLNQVYALKKELAALTGSKVLPIRLSSPTKSKMDN